MKIKAAAPKIMGTFVDLFIEICVLDFMSLTNTFLCVF